MQNGLIFTSTIICSICGNMTTEKMDMDSVMFLYVCPNCQHVFKTEDEECCIFCTYGSVPCLRAQIKEK